MKTIARSLAMVMLLVGSMVALAAPALADVQDFKFTSFHGDYSLTRDASRVGHLHVVEHLVAQFPDFDQNHGIIRAIPAVYQGHNVHLVVRSVTDEAGNSLHYTTSSSKGNLLLRVGDPNDYVHGTQNYVITYDQDHVTAKPSGYDGLFWDVNGDQWQQPFDQVSATIYIDPSLAAARDAAHDRCFTGQHGSTAHDCSIISDPGTATSTVDATYSPVASGETLTYELGFQPGTFAAYSVPVGDILSLLAKIFFFIFLPVGLALFFTVRRWWKYGRDPANRGVIVPEYVPPAGVSVLTSSAVIQESFKPSAITATILDLAVRGYLKIYETTKKELMVFSSRSYDVELVKAPASLTTEEQQVLALIFGPLPRVGARVSIATLSKTLYVEAAVLGKQVNQSATDAGYFRLNPDKAKGNMYAAGFVVLIVAFLVFSVSRWLGVGLGGAGLVMILTAQIMPARTVKGVALRDALLGLKMYMTVAEADRIRALQSPHGDLTEKIDVTDKTQLVKVNERLLPYAMLFGIEKQWVKEFAQLYEQPPEWYAGSGAFNAGYFAGSMSGFASASAASFSPPSSSGGGGSAGGGGGGGGGGGW
jgi:uncharacterized membrane protein YgcG